MTSSNYQSLSNIILKQHKQMDNQTILKLLIIKLNIFTYKQIVLILQQQL
jgi:hypothetical protein